MSRRPTLSFTYTTTYLGTDPGLDFVHDQPDPAVSQSGRTTHHQPNLAYLASGPPYMVCTYLHICGDVWGRVCAV